MTNRPGSKKRPARRTQNPLLIPGIILAAGILIFSIGGRLLQPSAPAEEGALQWNAPPPMAIDPAKTYIATLHTEKGDIVIELLAADAPITVNNFVFLARQGYYDGVTFHRVLPGFMAQSGDPTGAGAGGPGYRFQDEPNNQTFSTAGVVAMANSGPNTNGSQFFITYAPVERLNGIHTIFGHVIQGQDVAESLTPRDPNQNPPEPGDVIQSITIEER